MTCVDCMSNCAACISQTKCTTSSDGYFIDDSESDPSVINSCPVTCS